MTKFTGSNCPFAPQARGIGDSQVLMVDDESVVSDFTQMYLEDAGFKNFAAIEDPRQVAEHLRRHEVDLLLLDLNMPFIDGFQILRSLRASKRFKYLPVIVLTSASDAETKIKALQLGATDFLAKPVDASELVARVRNVLIMADYQRQLNYNDVVTGLNNRHFFLTQLQRYLHREPAPFAVLAISLDQEHRLKTVIGPQGSDDILQQFTERLSRYIASTKSTAGQATECWRNSLSRIGSADLALTVMGYADEHALQKFAQDIVSSVAGNYTLSEHEFYLSASVGIALYPEQCDTADELIRAASHAANQAKKNGGNGWRNYSESFSSLDRAFMSMDHALRKAIEQEEFELFYQPKIDLEKQRIVSVEALIRWRSANGQIVPPDEFIPLAEENGLIVPMGRWVINEAFRQLSAWQQSGMKDLSMAINVSPAQFFDTRFVDGVEEAARMHGTDLGQVVFEMTETTLFGDDEGLLQKLEAIKALGAQIAIDDFGTGYSSFNYLKRFPIDEIKIDRTFIWELPDSSDDAAIVGAILAMARSLNLRVVAEGVETEKQLAFLQRCSCDIAQGYLFSRPLPADDLYRFAGGFDFDSAAAGGK